MRNLISIAFLFLFSLVHSQYTVSGKVVDEEGNPVSRAVIKISEGENILAFGNSKSDGSFSLKVSTFGIFEISFNKINFGEYFELLSINEDILNYDLGEILLFDRILELEEVVIIAKDVRNRDTIEFIVADFETGFEFNVEDLLKNLPGFTVDKDGRIKVNDTPISRVLVEGDDLFSEGYTLLTQNIPAKPVETVEIIKNYSKNKSLRGVQRNDDIVINLKLDEKEKGKWMLSAELASTSPIEKMHQVKLNLMNFKSNQKIFGLFNYNNLGIEEMAGVNYLFRSSFVENIENVGELMRFENQEFISGFQTSFLKKERDNFNSDILGAFNLTKNYDKGYNLKIMSVFNRTERNRYNERTYSFHFDDTRFTNLEDNHFKYIDLNSVSKIEIEKEFKNANLNLTNNFYYKDSREDNRLIFNGMNSPQNKNSYYFKTDHQLNYSQKLDSISALSFVGKFINQNKPLHITEKTDAFDDFFDDYYGDYVYQKINERLNFTGFKASYAKNRKNKSYLEFQLGSEWKNSRFISDFFIGESNESLNEIVSFNNDYESSFGNFYTKAKYSKNITRRFLGEAEMNIHYLFTKLNYPDLEEKSQGIHFLPSVRFSYEKRKLGKFSIGYSRNYSQPKSGDFFRNYIFFGNRFLQSTEIFTRPLITDYFNFRYQYDIGKNEVEADVSYSMNDYYLSGSSLISSKLSITERIYLKENDSFSGSLMYSRFIDRVRSRITFKSSFQTSTYDNRVNHSELIHNRQNTTRLGVMWVTGWLKKFNFNAGYDIEFLDFKSAYQNSKYENQYYYINANYTFSQRFRAEGSFEIFKQGAVGQNALKFLDISINYNFKNSKTKAYLKLNNLLNEKYIETYRVTNVSETHFRQRIIPAHVVLGVKFNLL